MEQKQTEETIRRMAADMQERRAFNRHVMMEQLGLADRGNREPDLSYGAVQVLKEVTGAAEREIFDSVEHH